MSIDNAAGDSGLSAFAFSVSTNCAAVIDVGSAVVKRERWANSGVTARSNKSSDCVKSLSLDPSRDSVFHL